MKQTFLLCLCILFTYAHSHGQTKAADKQKTINQPNHGLNTSKNLKLEKIELTDSSTILSFYYKDERKGNIIIPDKSYIQPIPGGEKIFVKSTKGIPLSKWYSFKESDNIRYQLIFPALDPSVSVIDFGEGNDGGSWFIYDIAIRNTSESVLPKELSGNWFYLENGAWKIGLYDTMAIYKNKVWTYDQVQFKRKTGTIQLKNNSSSVELTLKWNKQGQCEISESGISPVFCTQSTDICKRDPGNDKTYETPDFELDTAVFCGLIKGYTPRVGIKTMTVHIPNIFTGNEDQYIIEIADNGYFSAQIPVYSPTESYIRSDIYRGSIYLEPGKKVFQLINTNSHQESLFMGESAKINTDLAHLTKFNQFNYKEKDEKLLALSANGFKEYCFSIRDNAIAKVDSILKTGKIGKKAWQVQKYELKYFYTNLLLSYSWDYYLSYYHKHNLKLFEDPAPYQLDELTAEFYDFLNEENVNNPLAAICKSYHTFLGKFGSLDILEAENKGYALLDISSVLKQAGHTLSDYEKDIIEKINTQNNLYEKEDVIAFNRNNEKLMYDFRNKYKEEITALKKITNNPVSTSEIFEYLKQQQTNFTQEDNQLLTLVKSENYTSNLEKYHTIIFNDLDSIYAFYSRYKSDLSEALDLLRWETYKKNLTTKLNIQLGFASDICYARTLKYKLDDQVIPLSDEDMDEVDKEIQTPSIYKKIEQLNEQTKLRIEANKKEMGYVVNDTPQTVADKLFDSMMEKYRGKVVYVDFWATWCGPCRGGIKNIKPLKDEMEEENVAFVYITDTSSPEETWSSLIPDIKGEHYRVSSDEWNYLSSKFNISGIPHYVLVGKNGEIIHPDMHHMSNGELKKELKKYL